MVKYKTLQNLLLLAIMLVVSCSRNNNSGGKDTDRSLGNHLITEIEVNHVIDKWVELWASYNLDSLNSVFLVSADLSYFSSEKEGLIKGYEMLVPHHEGFGFVPGGKSPAKELWLEDVETTLFKECAVVSAIWYFGDKAQGRETNQLGPVSFVLVRNRSGKLKIAHTNFSNY